MGLAQNICGRSLDGSRSHLSLRIRHEKQAKDVKTVGLTPVNAWPGPRTVIVRTALPSSSPPFAKSPDLVVERTTVPKEVARAVPFLVAEDAGHITGSNCSIDGGQQMF